MDKGSNRAAAGQGGMGRGRGGPFVPSQKETSDVSSKQWLAFNNSIEHRDIIKSAESKYYTNI